jgi:arginine decarboxylase
LFQDGLDLLALLETPVSVDGHLERPATPAYVRRLARPRDNFQSLHDWFAASKAAFAYPGELLVAYASKANPAEPVVRTLLRAGAAYECSSAFDVDILRHAHAQGWIDADRTILANGFKIPAYASRLIALRAAGFEHVLPIFDDLEEITPFAESGLTFEVGLRSRTDAEWTNRFGLSPEDMEEAAARIAASGTLTLTTFHAMQTVSASRGLQYHAALVHSVRRYAALRRIVPTLHRFDLGGGLPARNSGMDFQDWMDQTLAAILAVCEEEGVPAPDLIIESGRFLVQDHASKLFRVVKTRVGGDGVAYYMLDGSIMSSFPDAWALGDRFTVLPVNGWDRPLVPVRLAGLTCDHDDVYPTRQMDDTPLMLPDMEPGEELIIGFFDCGAYQETLGGRQGAKHCLLPEGPDLILDEDGDGARNLDYAPGQTAAGVLSSLGYNL